MAVAVEGKSGDGGFGAAGAGLAPSWANIEPAERIQAAATNADRLTLMLTPNLPLLPFLETVSAVDRNAVLIVITQEDIRVFTGALITETKGDVGC